MLGYECTFTVVNRSARLRCSRFSHVVNIFRKRLLTCSTNIFAVDLSCIFHHLCIMHTLSSMMLCANAVAHVDIRHVHHFLVCCVCVCVCGDQLILGYRSVAADVDSAGPLGLLCLCWCCKMGGIKMGGWGEVKNLKGGSDWIVRFACVISLL